MEQTPVFIRDPSKNDFRELSGRSQEAAEIKTDSYCSPEVGITPALQPPRSMAHQETFEAGVDNDELCGGDFAINSIGYRPDLSGNSSETLEPSETPNNEESGSGWTARESTNPTLARSGLLVLVYRLSTSIAAVLASLYYIGYL